MTTLETIFSFFRPANGRAALGGAVLERPAAPAADSVAAKRQALRAKIAGYADLTGDYDGFEGAKTPAQEDIDNAIAFISHIPDAGIETARTMVDGGGDVGFEWKTKKHYFEIGFSEGEVSYFGNLPNGGGRVLGDAAYDKNAGPSEHLQNLIDAIFAA